MFSGCMRNNNNHDCLQRQKKMSVTRSKSIKCAAQALANSEPPFPVRGLAHVKGLALARNLFSQSNTVDLYASFFFLFTARLHCTQCRAL